MTSPDLQAQLDYTIALTSAFYEKAMAYTTLVVGGGYVGFFTLWSFVREYLAKSDALWTAGIMGFSLLAFVCWQVFIMVKLTRLLRAFANAAAGKVTDFPGKQRELHEVLVLHNVQNARYWPFVFALTVIPGMIAGVWLMVVCIFHAIYGP